MLFVCVSCIFFLWGPPFAPSNTCTTHADYMAEMAANMPMLARGRGFHHGRVWIDSMHTVDMGVAPHYCGNVISEVVCKTNKFGNGSRKSKLDKAYADYRKFAKAQNLTSRLPKWTFEKLNAPSATRFPFMKAKAVECKGLVKWCSQLAAESNSGDNHDNWRAAAGWGLQTYYDIIDQPERYLSAESQAQLADAVETFLTSYYAYTAPYP